MFHEFPIARRRTVGTRIYHRVLGLTIWMLPWMAVAWATAGQNFAWWMAGILILFTGIGCFFIHFTLMEPDQVTISHEGLFTTVRGKTRSSFPFREVSELVLDGSALSLFAAGQNTLILADRDFRPEDWEMIKELLERGVPGNRVTLNRGEKRLRRQ